MPKFANEESQKVSQDNAIVEKIETLEDIETRLYQEGYTTDDLKEFLKQLSIKYGNDNDKISNTIQHESGWDTQAVSWNFSSHGIGQYTLSTWLAYCSDKDDRKEDPIKALKCMSKMWSQKLEYHWDAYCLLYLDQRCINLRGIQPSSL